MEKLTLENALLIENVVDKINEIIDELQYLDKRIDRHWAYHRRILKDKEMVKEGEKIK
jgi:hypothetical protein